MYVGFPDQGVWRNKRLTTRTRTHTPTRAHTHTQSSGVSSQQNKKCKKTTKNNQISSLWWPGRWFEQNMYKTLCYYCYFHLMSCGEVQMGQAVEQSGRDDGRSCRPPTQSLQSTRGRHTARGRLHRHTAFTQLPCGIATGRSRRDCRLSSWISEK